MTRLPLNQLLVGSVTDLRRIFSNHCGLQRTLDGVHIDPEFE
jgi:hypothetical protein